MDLRGYGEKGVWVGSGWMGRGEQTCRAPVGLEDRRWMGAAADKPAGLELRPGKGDWEGGQECAGSSPLRVCDLPGPGPV